MTGQNSEWNTCGPIRIYLKIARLIIASTPQVFHPCARKASNVETLGVAWGWCYGKSVMTPECIKDHKLASTLTWCLELFFAILFEAPNAILNYFLLGTVFRALKLLVTVGQSNNLATKVNIHFSLILYCHYGTGQLYMQFSIIGQSMVCIGYVYVRVITLYDIVCLSSSSYAWQMVNGNSSKFLSPALIPCKKM